MRVYPGLRECNWSTKRTRELWDYLLHYAPEIKFDNRRYFEMGNCVLDGHTGDLDYSEERFLRSPTTRSSELNYEPSHVPTPAWQEWYSQMDEHQRQVRDWSVGSAILGHYGLLFTFGQSRTGKSTLAEGLAEVLGSGAQVFYLSQNWGRFGTLAMENTTYLYDSDAKGSKGANNDNYATLNLMASGDPIRMEVKGGANYQTTNYGFVEVISNSPATMTFEQSLVDRVRFCLYTYISSKSDGGVMKRLILADKQAWLNYAVNCAIGLAKGDIKRPPINKYQMYGWVLWLRETNTYGRLCIEDGRILTYNEYRMGYGGSNRFLLTKETVDEMKMGFQELTRQYGSNFLAENWEEYGEQLRENYYAPKENAELF
ncbi:MAG: hypothetical protein KDK44_06560 [Chlamydiia bacterium]|nr:hypothetical protein [Chlamydiia bacterium]